MRPKATKTRYRLRNWREYKAALIGRGSLTLWVREAALGAWHDHTRTTRRGAAHLQRHGHHVHGHVGGGVSVDVAGDQGLLAAVLSLLKVELPVPDYTTLCRRRRPLEVSLPRRAKDEPLPVVVDATGIKV